MLESNLTNFITFWSDLPSEAAICFQYALCILFIWIGIRFFGKAGLFATNILCLVISSIEVLKGTQLTFYDHPIALGTIVFSMTFLCTDVVTECFSLEDAKKLVWLGFYSMLFFSLVMVTVIAIPPVSNPDSPLFKAHDAIKTLFLPAPSIFISGLISYLISQLFDVTLFKKLKDLMGHSGLWIRAGVSTALSALLDTVIFSLLAWRIFAIHPVDTQTLIWTYIMGSYTIRLLITLLNIPVTYQLRAILEKQR